MFKILVFTLLTTLVAATSSAQGRMCLDIFHKKVYVPLHDYEEISLALHQNNPTILSSGIEKKTGYVSVTGLERQSRESAHIATLEYTIQGNMLTINRLIERPEYYGQGLYISMVESILTKNLNVNVVAISLSDSFFQTYRNDLARLGDREAAVKQNPVYQQLETLGFKKVDAMFELNNTQQEFLRLFLSRPFE